MSYACKNCGKVDAWHVVSRYDASVDQWDDQCDGCGLEGGGDVIPDVFLHRAGQTFENLTDTMGKPYAIRSKRHKKEIMDRLGVSEAAGTVNGARFGTQTWIDGTRGYRRKQFEKDRPKIREGLKRWRETGYASDKR